MKKFVLMQTPSLQDPENPSHSFNTIGLKTLYPDKGYASCDKFGKLNDPFPRSEKEGEYKIHLAFLDEESETTFQGEKIVEKGITFAVVFWDGGK